MDEDIRKILEAAGWQPDDAFAELTHFNNMAHCGAPASMGDEDRELVRVARALVRYGATFSVVARGDSMIDAGISDGDILMVRQQSVAEEGDIVLVIVEGEEVMVKNYIEDDEGTVWFVPSNDRYPALCAEDYPDAIIVGKVVSIEHACPRASRRACMQRVREMGRTKKVFSAQRVAKAIQTVHPLITANRQWYAVYRSMVDESIIAEGDYTEFYKKVKDALDEDAPELDLKDIRAMAQMSFSKPLSLWNPDNAPVSGTRFFKYLEVGMAFKKAL